MCRVRAAGAVLSDSGIRAGREANTLRVAARKVVDDKTAPETGADFE